MKKYTQEEFYNIPPEVMQVKIAQYQGLPIGMTFYEETLKKYPEHFPEEIAHREKWEAVPEEVNRSAQAEYDLILSEWIKDNPKPKSSNAGIMAIIQNPEGYNEWREWWDKKENFMNTKIKFINDKHYKKYGVEKTAFYSLLD